MATLFCNWLLLFFLSFSTVKNAAPETAPHPFYVSVTEVSHNAVEKSLEISCKFFADDFEHVLEKAYKSQLDISTEKDKPAFNGFIPDYINKHLSFLVDGKPVKLNYVGYEKEKESVYCYFEVTNTTSLKRLDVINNLLFDLTQEQINIMHITVNGKRQSSKLSNPEVKASFRF